MSELKRALRDELHRAMRERDRVSTRALRSVVGALENAEADGVIAPRAGAVESAAIGVGAAEARRRELTASEAYAVVTAELDERAAAVRDCERAGQSAAAEPVREEIAAIRSALARVTTDG
ncbi:hypothetical protein CGZ93_08605 [Enemella dayhoffiae]|uniref:GatB/YqeY domain-containing protein n=1 Tax=Enemella dayhoffiae TaxID=2016507 RepID=A0A255H312_9ACTN|nr:hypothetical protein [Enemella dayhoffiae]OYO21979.1 hypothetical protein CGZ93_08605 [Enemella dayhoffiae]